MKILFCFYLVCNYIYCLNELIATRLNISNPDLTHMTKYEHIYRDVQYLSFIPNDGYYIDLVRDTDSSLWHSSKDKCYRVVLHQKDDSNKFAYIEYGTGLFKAAQLTKKLDGEWKVEPCKAHGDDVYRFMFAIVLDLTKLYQYSGHSFVQGSSNIKSRIDYTPDYFEIIDVVKYANDKLWESRNDDSVVQLSIISIKQSYKYLRLKVSSGESYYNKYFEKNDGSWRETSEKIYNDNSVVEDYTAPMGFTPYM